MNRALVTIILSLSGCSLVFNPSTPEPGAPDASSNPPDSGPDATAGADASGENILPFDCTDGDTVSLYHLDSSLADACGGNNNLTAPAVSYEITIPNHGQGLAGVATTTGAFDVEFPLSFDFWFSPQAPVGNGTLLAVNNGANQQGFRRLVVRYEPNGVQLAVMDDGCDEDTSLVFATVSLRAGEFYHVSVAIESAVVDGTATLSVLGHSQNTMPVPPTVCDLATSLIVGGVQSNDPPSATIDELRVSKSIRPPHEFQTPQQ